MKRIDTEGNVANLFFNGNPTLGQPATILDDSWANNVQEEIVNVVLDAGITLNGLVYTQLLTAIKAIMAAGGTQYEHSITNNQAASSNVTALAAFDKTLVKSVRMFFDVYRRTDSIDVSETGEIFAWHHTDDDAWYVEFDSKGDDAGVTFQITGAGQLQYQSSNMAGTSYAGTLRITNVTTIAQ